MATFIAAANGNHGDTLWGTVDATSLLDSVANNTVLTTAYVESATFTPGAITIDGIAVKVARRVASPTGTISVRLAQAGATVAGTEVTINVSDIPYGVGLAADADHNGWIFFKFGAPVLLVAATLYTVSAKTSSASQVHLFRDATAGNWSRMLRTTTLATLAAGDRWHVLGEWTAATLVTSRTITWQSTATTDYGDASTTIPSITVGIGGTLIFDTAAATNYILRFSGIFRVCYGGVYDMGTTGTPCPADSSMELQLDGIAADGDSGFEVFGTFIGQAPPRLAGVTNHYALLNTDEAIGQTTLGVDRQLSAKNGDIVALASTTRTATDAETVTLTADAGASTLTSGATTVAHGGTAPVQAEVICLNRHVRVVSTSTTLMGYVFFADTATVDCDWVWFRYMGTASTVRKRGVEISTIAGGSCSLNKCSFSDFDNNGIYVTSSGNWDNISITDCVGSKVGHQSSGHAFIALASNTTGVNWSVTGNVLVSDNNSQGAGILIAAFGGTISNNRMTSGGGNGYTFQTTSASFTGTFDGNSAHSNGVRGVSFDSTITAGRFTNTTVWRHGDVGIRIGSGATNCGCDMVFDTITAFGNTNATLHAQGSIAGLVVRSMVSNGDSTFATTDGVRFQQSGGYFRVRFEDCNFSTASGIKTAHTNDIDFLFGAYAELTFVDTILAAATEVTGISPVNTLPGYSFLAYQKHEGASGTNRKHYLNYGIVSRDATTFRTAAPSEKLEPTVATAVNKLKTGPKRVAVGSGQSCTIGAYVNKGGTYNGNAPRLRVAQNAAANIAEATVATHPGGTGSFTQLTGAVGPVAEDCVLEFYVDCDGSAGQVNVDDWSASVA